MRVYAFGGSATNICKQITNIDIDVSFIDSSLSNLKSVDPEDVYLVDGLDGAGKLRLSTHEVFAPLAEEVLIKFKPSDDLNVVVSSLAGGTGSVSGPLVVKKLLELGKPVIVVGIDSRTSVIETSNSKKTLETYKGISNVTKKSVALFYVENKSRKQSDERVLNFINMCSLLVNKSVTEEFDTADLFNFINFDRVTDNKPDVGVIEVGLNQEVVPVKGTTVVSTILLTSNEENTIQPQVPEYLATCIVSDPSWSEEDIRVDNVLGTLSNLIDELEAEINHLSDNKKVNKFKEVEVDSGTDGIVL